MNDERVGEHRIPKNTIVDRGGHIGAGGRINAELVRPPEVVPPINPPVAASLTTETPPAVPPQLSGNENPPLTTY